MTPIEEHAFGLGKIIVNLQSLEMILRFFICEAKGEPIAVPAPGARQVPETSLTNYMTLGQLIEIYNGLLTTSECPDYLVDPDVVRLRDAIAHGRALDQTPVDSIGPIRLFKFGRAKAGSVALEYDELLTPDWFAQSRTSVLKQITAILKCASNRHYRCLGTWTPL